LFASATATLLPSGVTAHACTWLERSISNLSERLREKTCALFLPPRKVRSLLSNAMIVSAPADDAT